MMRDGWSDGRSSNSGGGGVRNSSVEWQSHRDEVNLLWSQRTLGHSAALATYASLVRASRSTYLLLVAKHFLCWREAGAYS